MNTQKVKNMVIILLCVLNAVLFALSIIQANKYRLSAQQEKAVKTLLAENGINVSANIIKDFKPIKTLTMLPYDFDITKEAGRFFDGAQKTVQTESWNKITVGTEKDALSLEENVLRFESSEGYKTADFTKKGYSDPDAARRLCDDYIKKIKPDGLEFKFDHVEHDEDVSFYYYRGVYREQLIYSNYIRLRVNQLGITVASCYYGGVPSGFDNYAREIYAPNEALFSLMKYIKNIYSDMEIDVTGMEIVYNLEETALDVSKAVPCYRFQVSVNGVIISYLVDGYTNNVIK